MLRQLMKMYKNPKLNLKKIPDITFSGEYGADMGGPMKEFFFNAISSLTRMDPLFNIQLFGGNQGHLIPTPYFDRNNASYKTGTLAILLPNNRNYFVKSHSQKNN